MTITLRVSIESDLALLTAATLERHTTNMSSEHPSPASQTSKPQRVLACVLCQQRKVKCDRRFPCANCVKSRAQCVPATLLPRQRRRRYPERELLNRLRNYEELLRQNNISFDPLHRDSNKGSVSLIVESGDDSHDEHPENSRLGAATPPKAARSESGFEAKYASLSGLMRDG